jgi:DNA-binding NarL/FixJ family response regulator
MLRPQLILIDYNMPYLNGLDVVKQLKTLNLNAKIVIVSMYADKREMALFKEEGVDAFISKTTPAFKLINTLKSVMQGEKIFENIIKNKAVLEKDAFALKHELTKREMEILILVKQGHGTEAIAEMLKLSFYTVETHRKNVNQKMKFKSKKEFYDFLDEIDEIKNSEEI